MARRFSGRYSPESDAGDGNEAGGGAFHGQRRTRAGGRVNLLFLAPAPLALRAFWQDPQGLAIGLSAFGLMILAAWLTREGILAQEAYEARERARRPAIPRKLFASVLTGAGLFLGGLGPDTGLAGPAIFAGLGFALHLMAFGPDPLRDKGLDGADGHQSARAARAVDEAERHLAQMAEAIGRTGERALEARIERFQATARRMFRAVEADPSDLATARRHLGVYLQAARDASDKFAGLWARGRDLRARADYEALIDDLEHGFDALTRKLAQNDRAALDIEIEVLRERLARDGLSPED